jgi:hypothetical protein
MYMYTRVHMKARNKHTHECTDPPFHTHVRARAHTHTHIHAIARTHTRTHARTHTQKRKCGRRRRHIRCRKRAPFPPNGHAAHLGVVMCTGWKLTGIRHISSRPADGDYRRLSVVAALFIFGPCLLSKVNTKRHCRGDHRTCITIGPPLAFFRAKCGSSAASAAVPTRAVAVAGKASRSEENRRDVKRRDQK